MSLSVLPHGASSLNLDILQTTIQFVDEIPDMLTLSLLSKTVRAMAVRRLLCMAPIELEDAQSIRRFHAFLFVDSETRGAHVHTLEIASFDIDEESDMLELESLLCEILDKSRNLHTLWLPSFAVSRFPDQESKFQSAFEGLSSLREMYISFSNYADGETHNLIQKNQSPIRTLHTQSMSSECFTLDTLDQDYACLSTFLTTLQDLHVGEFKFFQRAASGNIIPWPSVRALTIEAYIGIFDLSFLLHWFPALEELNLGRLDETQPYERIRGRSTRSQENRSWARLDLFECNAKMLYTLALACPIRRLVLYDCCAITKHYVVKALNDNPPAQLYLTIDISNGLSVLENLLPEDTKSITRLTMYLYYYDIPMCQQCKKDKDKAYFNANLQLRSGVIWKVISAATRHLRLTHLRVVLDCDVRRPSGTPAVFIDMWQAVIQKVRDVDLRTAAATLLSGNSSLQYLFVSTSGYVVKRTHTKPHLRRDRKEWLHTGGWRTLHGADGGTTGEMEEIDSQVLGLVIAREEMDFEHCVE